MTEADRWGGLLYATLLAVVVAAAALSGSVTYEPVGGLLLVAALGYGAVVFLGPFARSA